MKNNYIKLTILAAMLFCTQMVVRAVQLNGTYTINPSAAATTTNFQNFTSAVTYMTSTGTRTDGGPANSGTVGVNGPVTFLVSAATYTEQVNIPAITGSSTTNTITFVGANKATTILQFNSTNTSLRHTLRLNLAANVTVRNMTIRSTSTTVGWIVHIMGANTNNNRIINCDINFTQATAQTSGSTNYIAVVINNSATSATTGARIDGTVIDSCNINAGYYGIVSAGSSGNLHVAARFSNNNIINSYLYGIYASWQNGVTMHNNVVSTRPSYQYNYGIYLLSSTCTSPNRHVITNNRINNFGYYGLFLSSSSNVAGNKGFIFNNQVGGLVKYEYAMSLYMASCSNWAISHNNFHKDIAGQSNTNSAVYITSGSGNSFRNNVCSEKIAGPGLALYASSPTVFDTMDYNVFYRPDTSNNVLVYIGTNLSSGSFRGASGQNVNSVYGNPNYPNDTALRMTNPCYQGVAIPYITTDYYGTTRNATTPSMGSYEVPSITNNLAVISITRPTPPIVAGLTDISVLVRNNGSNIISSFDISYRLNNGTPVTTSFFGTLDPCDTVTVTFSGGAQALLGNVNNFTIYTSNPNLFPDNDPTNDTLRVNYFLPLSGTYQIGGTTPDFASPSAAFDAIRVGGLTGPVTLVVNPGTYNDQITFETPVNGLSATNNITLIGTNKNTCIIQNANLNSSSRHIFRIGTSYVTIRDLTIRSTSANAGWGVHINKNGVKSVHVKNCIIENTNASAATSTSDLFCGVVMSGSNNSLYFYDTYVVDSIEIDSNIFSNMYAGVYQYSYFYSYYYTYGAPSENVIVRHNTMNNIYYSGVYAQGLRSVTINNNTVRMRTNAVSAYDYGIYVSALDANTPARVVSISNNRVLNANYMAYYIYNVKANATARGQFTNNAGNVGRDLANCYGLYMYNAQNLDVYHNSIINTMAATNNTQGALYFGYNSAMRLRSNHFINTNPSTMAGAAYIIGSSFTAPNMFDYNNFFRQDLTGQFIYIGNTWYTANTFKGIGSSNTNSLSINPVFASDTLLVPNNGCYNGDTISTVGFDINGNPRGARGDIGAYEVPASNNDIGAVELLAPRNPIMPGFQDVTVRFRNFGGNTVTSANIGYQHNAITHSLPWIGSLQACDTTSITFSGSAQINVTPNVLNEIKIFTDSPNAMLDSNAINDTIYNIIGTPMRGNYIVGAAPSDFTTINEAVNNLMVRGIDSNVVFLIRTGTYNTQINLQSPFGVDANNTVTFKSLAGHRDSVVISRNNTNAGDNFIVKFSNADYIRFEDLTLQALNSSFSYVLHYTGSSSNNIVRNCRIIANNVSTTSTNNTLVYANPLTGGNNSFVGNQFNGGSYGFYWFGTSTTSLTDNNVIDSNEFNNQYYMGVYQYYTANSKFRFNAVRTNVTYTAYYGFRGWYCDSALDISNNSIITTTATGYGIQTYYADGFTNKKGQIINNLIRIGTGGSNTNYGISDYYSSNLTIANNTAIVSSTSTASFGGYFYYTSTISNTTVIRNNAFVNLSTGRAIYYYNPTISSSDYNLYFTSGTVMGQRGTPAATYNTFADLKAAMPSNYDKNSIFYRLSTISASNFAPNVNDTAVWALNGRGTHLADVTIDINGNPRPTNALAGAPDIGAFEITPVALPPICTAVPATPTAGGTQVFLFAGDTVAKVIYDQFYSVPTSITLRQYAGVQPPAVDTSLGYTNVYLAFDAPIGFYNYELQMYYRPEWLGNVSTIPNLRLASKVASLPWTPFIGTASYVNATDRFIGAPFLNSFDIYTGTDNLNPLPVSLNSFYGVKTAEINALLSWSTASEINSKAFEIERSYNNEAFNTVGSVQAAGNSRNVRNYVYEDRGALAKENTVYYRLKMVDRDGTFQYSKTIQISRNDLSEDVVLAPNPFKNQFTVSNVALNDVVTIIDLNGKEVANYVVKQDGTYTVKLPNDVKSGIYLVRISGSKHTIIKVVKD